MLSDIERGRTVRKTNALSREILLTREELIRSDKSEKLEGSTSLVLLKPKSGEGRKKRESLYFQSRPFR